MNTRVGMWRKAFLISVVILVPVVAVILGASLPWITHATPATTQHQLPYGSVSGLTLVCGGPTTGYSCTSSSGYTGSTATDWAQKTSWAWKYYGCPTGNYQASGCPTAPHNCTLYAAYRLVKNGVQDPGWTANAYDWDKQANLHGVNVNQTPAVGAIAQWNASPGHVAYVESVDSTGITLTMDGYGLTYTSRVHINTKTATWPDNFLHFKDQSTPSEPAYYAGKIVQYSGDTSAQKTAWLVSPDLKRYWIPSSSIYNCLRSQGFAFGGAIGSSLLNQLPIQAGQSAVCGDRSLGVNQYLFRGSYLRSSNGLYSLQLQRSDGNLVLYGPTGALWTISTARTCDYLVLQGDSNLVTYGYGVGATWATGTVNSTANILVVQDDGNLVLYAPGGVPKWHR